MGDQRKGEREDILCLQYRREEDRWRRVRESMGQGGKGVKCKARSEEGWEATKGVCFITHSVDEKIIDANPQQEGPTDILVSEMLFPSISIPWESKSVKQVTTRSDITLHVHLKRLFSQHWRMLHELRHSRARE